MNRITQNMPLAVDPASKDQTRVNREITEVVRQLWLRTNTMLLTDDDLSAAINSMLQQINYLVAITGNIIRITAAQSPYAVALSDRSIYCDTDGGAITVELPVGVNRRPLTVKNCGSSGNDVTLTPNGTNLLFGVNASETMIDGEVLDMQYETTEGWF